MRIVIQRVQLASVTIDNQMVSSIGAGLMILVGVREGDTAQDVQWLAAKAANMRIFDDENGVMNRSVMDVDGEILAVSQFTLNASTKKGNRPSYIHAAGHELAVPLYDGFCDELQNITGKTVKKGVFGADMKVELINDGPVTIIVDSKLKE
ncbi:MAG: D-aminoacyl-tRNA deacylase [Muribaculaceae bacterium]